MALRPPCRTRKNNKYSGKARVNAFSFRFHFYSARATAICKYLKGITNVVPLKWAAEGTIVSDIGMIPGLSTRTVNVHISSAMKKSAANNKTSAVVMAAKHGLL